MSDLLTKIMGHNGKWQLRAVFIIYLCKIPSAWFMACLIFTAPVPKHGEFFCKPPIPKLLNSSEWLKISHPVKEELNDEEFSIDFCNVFEDAIDHSIQYFKDPEVKPWIQPNNNSRIIPCEQFEHNSQYNSIITQFDLVCSRDILVAVTQFFHLFGVLLGGIITTKILKTMSPRNIMLLGMYSQIMCGCLTGLVNIFELHMFFRCLSAVCCSLMYTAGGVIISDITCGRFKTASLCLFEQFWSIGVMFLPVVAGFWTSWSYLYLAISLPTFVLIFLHRWIPDSPRWLLQQGRIREAKVVLEESIKLNRSLHQIPYNFSEQLNQIAENMKSEPRPDPWWTIWENRGSRKNLVLVHLAWSLFIVVYYGMLLNVRSFGRDYLKNNTALAGASEIIGTFIGFCLIMYTTKKWFWAGLFNVVGGLVTYLAWVIPPEVMGVRRTALLMLTAMVAKTSISCCLSILNVCTTELVTENKKRGAAYSTIVWARIWLLGAPFIGATIIFGQLVPQTLFGSLTLIGGIIVTGIHSSRTHASMKQSAIQPEKVLTPIEWQTELSRI
ncbi:solute carrier family 22 member 21 [Malaya genurostris]|uniref:solute carrier family 22 member 21 n=1 Tax=Malaya genurostris TaxID=325434 RepID=UPI0026F3C745|nr:solute carrier family 22 member 21 [Malaya genurostris]